MKKFSLSKKAALAVFLILLPIFVTFIYGYSKNKAYLKAGILEDMTLIAGAYEGQVYLFLEMAKRRAEDFASDGFIRDRAKEIGRGRGVAADALNEHLLKNKQPLDKTIQAIYILTSDGRVASSTDAEAIGKDLSKEPFFINGRKGSSVAEIYAADGAVPLLAVSTPVLSRDTREPVGVIANFLLLSELNKLMKGEFIRELGAVSTSLGRRATMETYVVNREKLMMTESIFVKDSILKQAVDTLPVRECLSSARETSSFYKDYRGVTVAGAAMCMPQMRWTLLVEIDEEEVIRPLNILYNSAAVTAAVVSGLIAALFLLFLRYIVRPLNRLSSATGEIAEGRYDVNILQETSDEIGELCGSFNSMTGVIRKRTSELRTERNRAKTYLDVAGVVLLALDHEGRVTLINRKGCEVLGCNEKDIIGLNWFDNFIPEEEREKMREVFSGVLEGKGFEYYENPIVARSGEERVFAWYNTVLTHDDGEPSGTLSSGEDITERKRAEEELKRSEEKYRTLFEESKDVIFMGDPDGRVIDINPAGVELFGYRSREEMLKINIAKDIYNEPADRDRFRKEVEGRGFVKNFEVVLKKKGGEPLHAIISASVVRDEEGGITAYRGIMHDMTAYKKLEQQLFQAQKMEAIGQLTGGIAHDFNNILTAMIGYGNLLAMKMKKEDPLKEYVEPILSLADRASNLTQGLLAFSRKQIMNPKPVRINGLVRNIERLVSRLIGEEIDIKISLNGKDPLITADAGQIEQVLMNLSTNARDAMPGGGRLTIDTETVSLDDGFIHMHGYGAPGDYALITVTDTGAGMDKATLEKIFVPFFTTKEVGKGTGLGLSIVYGIVKQHSGYINVYSEPGKGTAFKIYLPLAKEAAAEAGPAMPEPPIGGTETVLVAEDDAEVRKINKMLLEEFGYRVIEAVDGEEAVFRFMEYKDELRLLLLDVIMPKKNGREAYDEIRRIDPKAKALFLSGYAEDIILKKGILEEGLNFISKPVSPTELLKKIREIIDKSR